MWCSTVTYCGMRSRGLLWPTSQDHVWSRDTLHDHARSLDHERLHDQIWWSPDVIAIETRTVRKQRRAGSIMLLQKGWTSWGKCAASDQRTSPGGLLALRTASVGTVLMLHTEQSLPRRHLLLVCSIIAPRFKKSTFPLLLLTIVTIARCMPMPLPHYLSLSACVWHRLAPRL